MKSAAVCCLIAILIQCSLQEYGKVPKNTISANKVKITDYVSLEVEINGEVQENRIEIGLFGDDRPQSVENFKQICLGTAKDEYGDQLSYSGSLFHRIIPGFIVQGGDALTKNGKNNAHIYSSPWKDEGNFNILHEVGCVGLANAGKDSSGSQFFILTSPSSFLDGKQIVFGRVLKGMEVVNNLESLGSNNGVPTSSAYIRSCQLLDNNKHTDL